MNSTLSYGDLQIHRWMLRDRQRVDAFQCAITALVRPGCVVLDLGAGSGILSLMAARAGAARVYAVERTATARLARRLAAKNGYAGVIQVAEDDMQHVHLPEQVDVIVSEWLGTIGVDENLLFPVLLARDRWLRPGGTMLPRTVVARVAAADLATACEIDFLRATPFGFDMAELAEASVHDLLCRRYQVRGCDLLTAPQTLWQTDTTRASLHDALQAHRAEVCLEATRGGRINALVAWFDAELAPAVLLSNAPDMPETHWGQLTLPLESAVEVHSGSRVELHLTCTPRVPGVSDLQWSVRIDEGPWQHHGTALSAHGPPTTHPGDHTMSPPDAAAAADPAPAPSPAAAALPGPADAAPLTCFLARLSVDVDMLCGLIRDPESIFEQQGLAPQDVQALRSRDASAIETAMMQGVAP